MKKLFMSFIMLVFILVVAPLASQASLADGKYELPYQVNEAGSTSASYGNDYFVKPATFIKKDGQMYVQFTLKNSSWITGLSGNEGGNKVISTNPSADTRVVQFNISNPSGKTGAKIKVDIDEISYHHEYDIDFVWFGDQATLIESYAKPAPAPVAKPAETKPAETTPKTQAPAAMKPAETKPTETTPAQTQAATPTQTKQPEIKTEEKKTSEVKTENKEVTKEATPEKDTKEEGNKEDKEDEAKSGEATPATPATTPATTAENDEKLDDAKQETTAVATQETTEEKVNSNNEVAVQSSDAKDTSSNAVFGLIVLAIVLIASIGYLIYRKKAKAA